MKTATRYERALATVSDAAASAGRFSRRCAGRLTPNHGTIVNKRPKLRRNRRVSVAGAPPAKFKRTDVYRLPIPHEVV